MSPPCSERQSFDENRAHEFAVGRQGQGNIGSVLICLRIAVFLLGANLGPVARAGNAYRLEGGKFPHTPAGRLVIFIKDVSVIDKTLEMDELLPSIYGVNVRFLKDQVHKKYIGFDGSVGWADDIRDAHWKMEDALGWWRFLRIGNLGTGAAHSHESISCSIKREPESYSLKFFDGRLNVNQLKFQPRSLFTDEHLQIVFSGLRSIPRSISLNSGLLQLPLHGYALLLHFTCLPPYGFKSPAKKSYLQYARCRQEEGKSPSSPVGPVSPRACYRHGGKFADSYGMACIFGVLFAGMGIMA